VATGDVRHPHALPGVRVVRRISASSPRHGLECKHPLLLPRYVVHRRASLLSLLGPCVAPDTEVACLNILSLNARYRTNRSLHMSARATVYIVHSTAAHRHQAAERGQWSRPRIALLGDVTGPLRCAHRLTEPMKLSSRSVSARQPISPRCCTFAPFARLAASSQGADERLSSIYGPQITWTARDAISRCT
jgi:hypothetical protein